MRMPGAARLRACPSCRALQWRGRPARMRCRVGRAGGMRAAAAAGALCVGGSLRPQPYNDEPSSGRREIPMSSKAFRGTVVLPAGLLPHGVVVAEKERIVAVGPESDVNVPAGAEVIDAHGGYVSPGFVDIHTHGGAGSDYMDGTPEAVRISNHAHARHGTTTLLPTTTTGTPAQLTAMLDAVELVRRDWGVKDGARVAGVHWYGPYFATDKVGAHPKGYERHPDPAEYGPALARGIIRSATCAAELPGAVAFCRAAKAAGCLVTCGHSNASWPEMAAAYEAGMRHVDHFWNAMSSTDSIRKRR